MEEFVTLKDIWNIYPLKKFKRSDGVLFYIFRNPEEENTCLHLSSSSFNICTYSTTYLCFPSYDVNNQMEDIINSRKIRHDAVCTNVDGLKLSDFIFGG